MKYIKELLSDYPLSKKPVKLKFSIFIIARLVKTKNKTKKQK